MKKRGHWRTDEECIEDGVQLFVWSKRRVVMRDGAKIGEAYLLGTREETASLMELLWGQV